MVADNTGKAMSLYFSICYRKSTSNATTSNNTSKMDLIEGLFAGASSVISPIKSLTNNYKSVNISGTYQNSTDNAGSSSSSNK